MTRHPTAYTAGEKPLPETPDELRARIPGWGADLDPADRPSVPKLSLREDRTGAHWDFPDRQPELAPRERSVEHAFVTPVFGTAQPRKGLSGLVRGYAYRRHGEAKAAHWLLLLAADRVDAVEEHLRSFATLRPDNPLTETGLTAERHGGWSSRVGRRRTDLVHQPLDPVVVAGPWLLAGGAVALGLRALRRAARG